jgi:cell division protein FtsQ
MDRRVRARRRTVGRERGRKRATVVAVILVVIACAALFLWLRSSDVFAVKRVTATPTEHVTIEEIYEATAAARGVSLLRLSTQQIEAELSDLPYARSVEVHRRFPDTLEVELVECMPVASVRTGSGQIWSVAEDGKVLELANRPNLPLIVAEDEISPVPGDNLPEILTGALSLAELVATEDLPETLPALDHIAVSTGGELTIFFKGGTELRLGEAQALEQKLTVAASIIEQYLRDGRQLHYVDARVPERPAVNAE